MTDINVADFFKDAAKTLSLLYADFPRPVSVYVDDISGPDEPDEFGIHSRRHLACFGTMLWLAEEGYIRYGDTDRQLAIESAVLTGRCFTRLTAPDPTITEAAGDATLPPSVRQERASRIYQIRKALKSGSSNALKRHMMDLMNAMLAG